MMRYDDVMAAEQLVQGEEEKGADAPHRQGARAANDERGSASLLVSPSHGYLNGRAYLGAILIPPSLLF
jgi:hypothetical protein